MFKITTITLVGLLCTQSALAQNAETSGNAKIVYGSTPVYTGPQAETIKPAPAERVSSRTFEVTVDGNRNQSRRDVMDKALYKAAKKTLKYNYDWFRIIDKETDRETVRTRSSSRVSAGFETVPERRCGPLGCTTSTRTRYNGGFDNSWPEREDRRYSVTIEFETGLGAPRSENDVYDARIVKKDYR